MFLFGGKCRFIMAVVFAAVALVSCANPNGVQETSIGSCTPAVAATGDQVVCKADLEEDCTLFFDKTPIAYERNASEGTLKFTVPPTLAGEVNVTARCGEGSQILIQDGFSVVSPTLNPEVPSSKTSPEVADGGETITPSAPAAVPSEVPSAPETAPYNPESAPSGGQAPASLTVEKVENAVHFSAHRIHWDTGHAKAAYLAGNVFTRFWMDGGLTAPCKATSDGRYLVTNPDGTNLNPGSANFEAAEPYREGSDCELRNCEAEIFAGEPDTVTPFCRIDLTKETDQIFVRSLTGKGRVCLAVQGDDDVWSTTCKTIDAPKPELVVKADSVAISETKPVIELKFDYNYGMGRPMAGGCTELSGSSGPDKNGHGIYVAECPLNQIKTTVSVSLQGAGGGNVDSRPFEVVLWKNVSASLNLFGAGPGPDPEDFFQLQYGVSRTYSVLDQKAGTYLGGFRNCPWVKAVRFKGFAGDHDFHAVTQASDVGWIKSVSVAEGTYKTDAYTKWVFTTQDFDDTYESAFYQVDHATDANTFSLQIVAGTGGTVISGDCDDGLVTLKHQFQWKGHNVKSISLEGEGLFAAKLDAGSEYPNVGPDKDDEGDLYISQYLGDMSDEWDASLNFTLKVVFYGGATKTVSKTVSGYSCH